MGEAGEGGSGGPGPGFLSRHVDAAIISSSITHEHIWLIIVAPNSGLSAHVCKQVVP